MQKKTLIALVGATIISTPALADDQILPAQEPVMVEVPVFDPSQGGTTGLIGNGPVVLGALGLLILGALAAGGGS